MAAPRSITSSQKEVKFLRYRPWSKEGKKNAKTGKHMTGRSVWRCSGKQNSGRKRGEDTRGSGLSHNYQPEGGTNSGRIMGVESVPSPRCSLKGLGRNPNNRGDKSKRRGAEPKKVERGAGKRKGRASKKKTT